MTLNTDPRTPDITHTQSSVLPMVIMVVVVIVGACVAYKFWPQLQQVFSPAAPSETLAPKTQ